MQLLVRVLGLRRKEEPVETRMIASINATCEAAAVTLVEVPSRKKLDWPNAERRRDIEAAITAKHNTPARWRTGYPSSLGRVSSGVPGVLTARTADPHRH